MTATEAKTIADQYRPETAVPLQLLDQIERAASRGEYELRVETLTTDVARGLRAMGYEVGLEQTGPNESEWRVCWR